MAVRVETEEDAQQLADLASPPGPARSGIVRYAAAMYFYRRGMIGEAALEIYRICSQVDHEDPAAVLARVGLAGEAVPAAPAARTSVKSFDAG